MGTACGRLDRLSERPRTMARRLKEAERESRAFAGAVHADGAGEEVRLVVRPRTQTRRPAKLGHLPRSSSAVRRHLAARHWPDRHTRQRRARAAAAGFGFNGWVGNMICPATTALASGRRVCRPALCQADWILEAVRNRP